MTVEEFHNHLLSFEERFREALTTPQGDWVVKGFIDVQQNIYTISVDTKVISKIIELMLFPIIAEFATRYDYQIVVTEHQNHYPDITFIAKDKTKFAVDFKSTYRISPTLVSGFTLGAFTGYFAQRDSVKNITFPYQDYAGHFVVGIVYSRTENVIDERKRYKLEDLADIASVARDFDFILQEKWRIAHDKPGSGNTKNIGSIKNIDDLIAGQGTFSPHSEKIFDDYWMNYLTRDMARAIDKPIPYRNLEEYFVWRENLLK